MKKFILSMLAAGSICFATNAMAGGDIEEEAPPPAGWYLDILGGAWLGEEPDVSIAGIGRGDYDPDDVFTVMAAIGAPVAPNIRAELNLSVTSGGDGNYLGFAHVGSFSTFTAVGNAIYDFNFGLPFQPFIGGGAGVAITSVNNLRAVGGAFSTNDTDAALIVNGLVGFNVPINDRVALTARYTFGWMDSLSFQNTGGFPNSRQDDQFIHAATGGIRINLN